jgi:hypothetical protein
VHAQVIEQAQFFSDFGFGAPVQAVNAEDGLTGSSGNQIRIIDPGAQNTGGNGFGKAVGLLYKSSNVRSR